MFDQVKPLIHTYHFVLFTTIFTHLYKNRIIRCIKVKKNIDSHKQCVGKSHFSNRKHVTDA